MTATLLVELLTEELPPRALKELSDAFAMRLFAELQKGGFLAQGASMQCFATPRRLAASITAVEERSPDSARDVQGPPAGAPPQAVAGFAKKSGVAVESLKKQQTPKGEVYVAHVRTAGRALADVLSGYAAAAVKALPVPKMMRWGSSDAQFVRPAHGLVMLHGSKVVPGKVLDLESGNRTHGHRFLGKGEIVLAGADEYESRLATDGRVVASFARRRDEIDRQLKKEAERQGGRLGDYHVLLDEVTALVEFPVVYVGKFDPAYLEVPQECLILTMRQNQKYFPLFDETGKLTPRFLIVSNMEVADPRHIVGGNERVVRPRLEDARFFYDQDRKTRLEARVPELAKVVYHNKLGTQLERVQRIQLLAGSIARSLQADAAAAERAAWLSKADLLTGMVGEFPELQGVMGRYYALHDKEPAAVAAAIEGHYRPRFAGDALPEGEVACAVALADKLVSLVGLFGVGEEPTGERDPFGLRRAALGLIRIVVERNLSLHLDTIVGKAFDTMPALKRVDKDVLEFIHERFAGYLKDLGFSTLQVDAVLSTRPSHLNLVPRQLEAVKTFQSLPEAESLAAANKRVANILRQAQAKGESFERADSARLTEPAERKLFQTLHDASARADGLFDRGDYAGYLKAFAVLKAPVDEFFDSVMVMAEEKALRQNRLALLSDLRRAMNRVADLSRLAVDK